MDMWPATKCPTTLIAPKYHKQAGRPPKKRKKSAAELEELKKKVETSSKMPRKGDSLTCSLCKKKGHNKRTCNKSGGAGGSTDAGASNRTKY